METKELNLYKVYLKTWATPTYVAAKNQAEALDKARPSCEPENIDHMNVEWVAEVTV